jgi:hypothetical protein
MYGQHDDIHVNAGLMRVLCVKNGSPSASKLTVLHKKEQCPLSISPPSHAAHCERAQIY